MIYSTFKIDGKQVSKKEYERYKRLEQLCQKKKNKTKVHNKKHRIKRKKREKLRLIKNKDVKRYASYKEYLKSPEWKKIRLRILKRANNKCEVCKIGRAYQVHHKHYKNIFNEKDKDLIAICGTCHQDKHKILTEEQIEKRVNKLMQKEGYK